MTNSNNSEYITIKARPIIIIDFLWIAFLFICLLFFIFIQANIIIILSVLTFIIIEVRTYLIGFKYNNKNLIVFNILFGKIAEYRIKDIVYISKPIYKSRIGCMIKIYTDRDIKLYYIDALSFQRVEEMITYIKQEIDRLLFNYRFLSDKENKEKRREFKCRKIHIKPEKGLYIKLLLSFYLLYILAWVIWWNNIISSEWIILCTLFGIPLPITIYQKKMLRTANNIYLDNCTITINNEKKADYRKKIPFEAINRIKYANGIVIELKTGPKIKYKICGDQARKRLGIEKIIGEFERFKKMMRQDVAD